MGDLVTLTTQRDCGRGLEVTWAALFLRPELLSRLVLSPACLLSGSFVTSLGEKEEEASAGSVKLRQREEAASPGRVSARMKTAKE